MRVIIAEDQKMLASALGALLSLEDDIDVVGIADNGEAALALIEEVKPDVAILDIEMPLLSGLDVAERVTDCKVVMVTTFARQGYFKRAVQAGVAAYLLKDGSSDDLADALRQVMSGKKVYAAELMEASAVNTLTEREQQLLSLLKEGLTTAEIADRLFISPGTARNYASQLFSKLGAKNRSEAVYLAEQQGLL